MVTDVAGCDVEIVKDGADFSESVADGHRLLQFALRVAILCK